MNRTLIARSIRDSWLLAVACAGLTAGFIVLRVWVASKIKFDMFIRIFSGSLKMFQNLLPVPIEDLASPLGRTAFSYEEMPVILLLGLWCVTRGSDCVAGRVGAGTMEMLLAQPLRRITLVASHSLVTLAGVVLLAAASWIGVAAGLAVSEFDPPQPVAWRLLPGTGNYLGLGVFLLGAATLASALFRTRSQAVAAIMALYVIQLAIMIVARLSPSAAWLERFTILSAYEPTLLTIGLARDGVQHWPMFWQYNAILIGLGFALWGAAAAVFCHRDVPAPL